ncbi:MAG: hypothetical protein KDD66_10075 [Bdellovibrionales bacterium]|nr:hypothetical protein [Bdellovibrionales bacterium]
MDDKEDSNIQVNSVENHEHDYDRPTMRSFIIVEGFKWGGAAIAVYVIASFVFGFIGPSISRLFAFLSWLFFGDQPPSN